MVKSVPLACGWGQAHDSGSEARSQLVEQVGNMDLTHWLVSVDLACQMESGNDQEDMASCDQTQMAVAEGVDHSSQSQV